MHPSSSQCCPVKGFKIGNERTQKQKFSFKHKKMYFTVNDQTLEQEAKRVFRDIQNRLDSAEQPAVVEAVLGMALDQMVPQNRHRCLSVSNIWYFCGKRTDISTFNQCDAETTFMLATVFFCLYAFVFK